MSLVSVVIPTYNRSETLRRAIESVLAQTYTNLECIVVDDASVVDVRATVASFDDPRLAYHAHDRNQGAHAARDTGLDIASGRYIQFLDDDDRLYPEKIARQIKLLKSNPSVGVAHCGSETEPDDQYHPIPVMRGNVLDEALAFRGGWNTSVLLIERASLNRIRPLYRDSPGADDLRMLVRLAATTRFDYLDDILVDRGPGSRGASWGALEGRRRILADYDALYAATKPSIRRRANEEIHWFEGRCYLSGSGWTMAASLAFLRSAYYAQGRKRLLRVAEAITALGGRRGTAIASRFRSLIRSSG